MESRIQRAVFHLQHIFRGPSGREIDRGVGPDAQRQREDQDHRHSILTRVDVRPSVGLAESDTQRAVDRDRQYSYTGAADAKWDGYGRCKRLRTRRLHCGSRTV
jgi:hypothetical protein